MFGALGRVARRSRLKACARSGPPSFWYLVSGGYPQCLAEVFLVQPPLLWQRVFAVTGVLAVVADYEQVVAVTSTLKGGSGDVQFQSTGETHTEAFIEDAAVHACNGWLDNVGTGCAAQGHADAATIGDHG